MKRFAIIMLALCVCLVAACSRDDSETKKEIAKVLRENPQLILDALEASSEQVYDLTVKGERIKRIKDMHAQWEAVQKTPRNPNLVGSALVMGPADAPVTLVEYSDLECGYCALTSQTIKELVKRHPDKLRVVFKHFVLPQHKQAKMAARYVEAAALQDVDKAWQLHDAIFADQNELIDQGEPWVIKTANDLGLNLNKLVKDASSPEIAAKIEADTEEARAFGFSGTPTLLMNGVAVPGGAPLDVLEDIMTVAEQYKTKQDQQAELQAEKDLAAAEHAADNASAVNATKDNATSANATEDNATKDNVTTPSNTTASNATPGNATKGQTTGVQSENTTDDQSDLNLYLFNGSTTGNQTNTTAGPAKQAPAGQVNSTPSASKASPAAPASKPSGRNVSGAAGPGVTARQNSTGGNVSVEASPANSTPSAEDVPVSGQPINDGTATSPAPIPNQPGNGEPAIRGQGNSSSLPAGNRLNATGPDVSSSVKPRLHKQPFGRPVQPPAPGHETDQASRLL